MQLAADLLGWRVDGAAADSDPRVAFGCLSVDAFLAKVAFELIPLNLDQLTGLPARRQCHSVLERHLRQNAAGAAVITDVDDLREFNSAHGYVIADRALQAVARSLRSAVIGRADHSDEDEIFRLGGDEFLIFLGGSDAGTAVALAKQARSEVKRATADLIGRSLETRTLTARFAVVAWSEGSAPGLDVLMAALDDGLDNAGPDVVVLVGLNEG